MQDAITVKSYFRGTFIITDTELKRKLSAFQVRCLQTDLLLYTTFKFPSGMNEGNILFYPSFFPYDAVFTKFTFQGLNIHGSGTLGLYMYHTNGVTLGKEAL